MKKIFPPAFFMDAPDSAEKFTKMAEMLGMSSLVAEGRHGNISGGLLNLPLPSPLAENGRYEHWGEFRFLPSEMDSSPEERWQKMKLGRFIKRQPLPLVDSEGGPLWFCQLDELAKFQSWIDRQAAGMLGAENPAAFDDSRRKRYVMDGLINEAISSSQLEGAATTRIVARKILAKPNPKPADDSETMIVNNYRAMEFIGQIKRENLSLPLILELHRILTKGVLADDRRGQLRREDDIAVWDNMDNAEMHRPPPARELHSRLERLCDFANGKISEGFLHPSLRAIILHFMLAYEHPFVDGNGRTARALFYWAMAHNGYWMMPFVSISQFIHAAPRQYYRAFIYSETDGGDITYFLLHQIRVIKTGFEWLARYIKKQSEGMRAVDSRLGKNPSLAGMNERQIELLRRAMQEPREHFSAREHQARHRISYPSARSDLLTLADKGLLVRQKTGREYLYFPSDNLRTLLKS